MEQITVREYTINDIDRCRDILYKIQINDFRWVDKAKVQLYDFDHITEGEKIFVACINNEVVAFASIWEEDFFLHSLYIDDRYRRNGVGKKIIDFLLDYYNQPLSLKCVKENTSALSFYLALGWVILKEEDGEDGPYYLIRSKPY